MLVQYETIFDTPLEDEARTRAVEKAKEARSRGISGGFALLFYNIL